MIIYLDTSALLKKYFKEPGSSDVIAEWKKATGIITSSVAYAESLASFYRKKREVDINTTVFSKVVSDFRRDWQSIIRIDVTDNLNETIDEITRKFPLRGFDAVHLASALIVSESIDSDFLFVCYDKTLNTAARRAGLSSFPERFN